MAGFPQLRESAWLYGPDDPWLPLALARLFEHKDGTGRWELRVNSPAEAPTETVEYPDEATARAALKDVYGQGEPHGEWRIRQIEPH